MNKINLFVLVVYLTGSMPIQGMCSGNDSTVKNMAKDLFVCIETDAEEMMLHKIKELEMFFEDVSNPFEEGRKFIQSFVDELNLRYGTQLTIADACVLVRNNFDRFQLPQNYKKIF